MSKEIRGKLGTHREREKVADGPVVREGRYTSEDVFRALFEAPPEPRTLEELKTGARRSVKNRWPGSGRRG
jgi:hypothetical protein